MPRDSGVAILGIKPDSDLGVAQGASTPVPVVAPLVLDQVNKANQDLRAYQLQRNIMKYDHQLKQRDNLIKGLHEGEISTGAILPEDREAYNKAEQEVRKAFLDVTSEEPDAKGQNAKLANFHDAKQRLQDLSTMLQSRYVGVGKKRQDLSKAVLPSEQKRRQADIDKSINSDKWAPVIPYQEDLDFDPDYLAQIGINGAWVDDNGNPINDKNTVEKVTTNSKGNTVVQKTTTPIKATAAAGKNIPITGEIGEDGKLPIYTTTPGSRYEYRNTLANMIRAYNEDEKARVMMDKQFEMYQFTEDPQAQALFNVDNQGLAIMDQQNGIPTIKHYPDKFNRTGPPSPDPNDPVGKVEDTGIYPSEINHRYVGNKLVIEESAPTLAAKLFAGKLRNYKVEGQKYIDKDAFKLNLEVDKYKADLLNDKGKRALEWAKFKDKFNATKHEDFASAASVLNEATSIINNGEAITIDDGGGKTHTSLRIGDPTLLATFGNIDKEGNVTNVPDAINYDKDKNQGVLIYYGGKTASGKNIVVKEVPFDQRTWLKHITKRSFPNKEIGNVNTIIDNVLEKNNNSLYDIAQKSKKQNTQPAAGTYSWNGNDYSEDEIKQGAAAEKLSVDAYIKKHGIKKK